MDIEEKVENGALRFIEDKSVLGWPNCRVMSISTLSLGTLFPLFPALQLVGRGLSWSFPLSR